MANEPKPTPQDSNSYNLQFPKIPKSKNNNTNYTTSNTNIALLNNEQPSRTSKNHSPNYQSFVIGGQTLKSQTKKTSVNRISISRGEAREEGYNLPSIK